MFVRCHRFASSSGAVAAVRKFGTTTTAGAPPRRASGSRPLPRASAALTAMIVVAASPFGRGSHRVTRGGERSGRPARSDAHAHARHFVTPGPAARSFDCSVAGRAPSRIRFFLAHESV